MSDTKEAAVAVTRMVRDPGFFPAPHSADVHADEIDNYRLGGFVLVAEANFDVPEAQAELPLAESFKPLPAGDNTLKTTGNDSGNPFGGAPLK